MLSSLGSNALPGAQYFNSRRSVKVSIEATPSFSHLIRVFRAE